MNCRFASFVLASLALQSCGLVLPRYAQAQPNLTHAIPHAVAPGKTTELTLHGAKLVAPFRVWTSFPAQVEVLTADASRKDAAQATCKLTLSANVPVGVGGIAVATADGL